MRRLQGRASRCGEPVSYTHLASSAPNRPFLPAVRTEKNTSQAKAIETMGKGAQVRLPETAVLITAHAALPANSLSLIHILHGSMFSKPMRKSASAHEVRAAAQAADLKLLDVYKRQQQLK